MYNQNGSMISIARNTGNKIEEIPAGCYTLEYDPRADEFYLQETPKFSIPSKIYGKSDQRADKVIKTYLSREGKNTGVLLSGTKGSGKTQLAKDVSNKLLDCGIPTIIIQNCYVGGTFINFIKEVSQRALILFDEFEKVYVERQAQEAILTLFDGTGSYNKLYILTTNKRDISEFLRNRPSRMFYHFEYNKLPKETMNDLIQDQLNNKSPELLKHFQTLWDVAESLSFDVVQSLIEELNRYPEQTFAETFKELNVEIDTRYCKGSWFPTMLTIDGKTVSLDEDNYNYASTYTFMSNAESLRAYVTVDTEELSDEVMLAAGGEKYSDKHDDPVPMYSDEEYCDDEFGDEICSADGVALGKNTPSDKKEYVFNFQYNETDTKVSGMTVNIRRVVNGHKVHIDFTKVEEPDPIDSLFGK